MIHYHVVPEASIMGTCIDTRFALAFAINSFFFILSVLFAKALWEDASEGAGLRAWRGGRCGSAQRDPLPQSRTDMQKRWDAHKMLRARRVTGACLWTYCNNKTATRNVESSPAQTEGHEASFAAKQSPPASCRSSDTLHLCMNPPLGWRLQNKTGRRWRPCVPSVRAPFLRFSTTTWHLRQDGVNHLHEIHRRISAVRGAGEVRAQSFLSSGTIWVANVRPLCNRPLIPTDSGLSASVL